MTAIHAMYRPHHGLDERVSEVLELGQYAILGTTNRDGSTHLTPVMYLFDGDRIYIETSAATRKARNAAATGRATILVLDRRADDAAWVSGAGPAELIEGAEAQRAGLRIRSRYFTQQGEAQVGSVLARYDDVVIAVRPEKWMAWDMNGFYATLAEHGVSLDGSDEWFLPTGT